MIFDTPEEEKAHLNADGMTPAEIETTPTMSAIDAKAIIVKQLSAMTRSQLKIKLRDQSLDPRLRTMFQAALKSRKLGARHTKPKR